MKMHRSLVALLATTSFAGVAQAQQQGQTTGEALNVPSYSPVDGNGVNLLSGSLVITSPKLSMASAQDPTEFYLTWQGRGWLAHTPHLYLDKDWNVIVEFDGTSDEFGNAVYSGLSTSSLGKAYDYTQKRPNSGASLRCFFIGGVSGNQWITKCEYVSRQGVSVGFYGHTVSNGTYPSYALYDNEQFGNTMAWPWFKSDPARGVTYYVPNLPGNDTASAVKIDSPNGIYLDKAGDYNNPNVTFTMTNRAVPAGMSGSTQTLVVNTPNLSTGNTTNSYLRPKNTTQTFTSPGGRLTSYTFNGNGDITKIISPAGIVVDLTYDSYHRVKTYKVNGQTWNYEYSFTFADPSDTPGWVKVTAPDGGVKQVWHRKRPGGVSEVKDELNRSTKYTYDSNERLTLVEYAEGNTVGINYDGRGNVSQVTQNPKPGSGGAAPLVTKSTYDSSCSNLPTCNKPNRIFDPRYPDTDVAHSTEYTYSYDTGLPTVITYPANADGVRAQTKHQYLVTQAGGITDGRTMPVLAETSICQTIPNCAFTADEVKTAYIYGATPGTAARNLLPTKVINKLGDFATVLDETAMAYDATGNVVTIDGPLSGPDDTTRQRFDAARQMVGTVGPDPDGAGTLQKPQAERVTFNADGKVTLVEKGTVADQTDAAWAGFAPYLKTATGYDPAGRPNKVAVAGSGATVGVTEASYDLVGRVKCTAVRMNPASFPTIGANGQLTGGSLTGDACAAATSGTGDADRIEKKEYDVAGQLLQVRRGVGTPLEQAYVTYAYSANGKQSTVIDANGNRAQLGYDGFDRQTRWSFPSLTRPATYAPVNQAAALAAAGTVNPNDYEEYGYDQKGNRISLRKRDGRVLVYNYDALSRVTSKIVSDGCAPIQVGACPLAAATRDVYYSYDLRGLQKYARFDSAMGNEGITSNYDARGHATASTITMGGFTRTLGYEWDVGGRRTRLTHPDGNYFVYNWDVAGRLSSIFENGSVQRYSNSYDTQGRLASQTAGAVVTNYGYDNASRLTALGNDLAGTDFDISTNFIYNPVGQIISKTRSNDSYAFQNYLDVSRTYGTNGLNQYTAAGPASFTYDANGNLISDGASTFVYDAENRLVSANGAASTQLTYDPQGRLFSEGGRQFLYDGDELVSHFVGSSQRSRIVHGPGVDDPLFSYQGATLADFRSLQVDHQGSIVSSADATGNRLNIMTYDEYGIPGAGNTGNLMYTGQQWISLLGMYYYKARMYSPSLGRFMQTDPIGYEDQMNLYSYVVNNPINARDPSGERVEVNLTFATGIPACSPFGGCYMPMHMNIRITPDDQESIQNLEVFNRVDENGKRYATLSAGPEGVPEFSNLKSTINRAEGDSVTRFNVPVPRGFKTENQFINALFKADGTYNDKVPYTLFPTASEVGRNSNSYVSGVLKATGLDISSITKKTGWDVPGADVPLILPCQNPNGIC